MRMRKPVVFLAALLLASAASAQVIGMVIDLHGETTIADAANTTRPLAAMEELRAGQQLRLAQGARVVLTLHAAQKVFCAKGPAAFELRPAGIVMQTGKVPEWRSVNTAVAMAPGRSSSARSGATSMKQAPVEPDKHAEAESTDHSATPSPPERKLSETKAYVAPPGETTPESCWR